MAGRSGEHRSGCAFAQKAAKPLNEEQRGVFPFDGLACNTLVFECD
jgi:hypothetical protein